MNVCYMDTQLVSEQQQSDIKNKIFKLKIKFKFKLKVGLKV